MPPMRVFDAMRDSTVSNLPDYPQDEERAFDAEAGPTACPNEWQDSIPHLVPHNFGPGFLAFLLVLPGLRRQTW